MSLPARFRQADVTRAIKAATAAGMRVGRIEIDPNGRIVILPESATPSRGKSSWDDVLP